jgi:hypothetical protein
MRQLALILLGPMLLASCATITTGRFEDIHVSSSPSAADAALVCGGQPSGEGRTPATFKIRRNAGDCTLTVRKEGFADQSIALEQGVNPIYWSNMVFSPLAPAGAYVAAFGDSGERVLGVGLLSAGFVIFATDFWTGAVHAHKPGSVDVVLKPRGFAR